MNTIVQFLLDNELIILAFICGCLLGVGITLLSKEEQEDADDET